jgi:cyclohexyl-isocyanide hydratase
MSTTETPIRVGLLLFPNLTQLDLTGPYEVFARVPGGEVHLVARTLDPVRSDQGLTIVPTTTLEACPRVDVLCVPGGPGVNALLEDAGTLGFIRRAAAEARFVTSVCSGSLLLGAAGLLRGRRAASHWMSREFLRAFGAEPVAARTVVDGNVITGGGVTAGIDLALRVVAELAGPDAAKTIQLMIEYDPAPPFDAGTPEQAGPAIVGRVTERARAMLRERAERVRRAAATLGIPD